MRESTKAYIVGTDPMIQCWPFGKKSAFFFAVSPIIRTFAPDFEIFRLTIIKKKKKMKTMKKVLFMMLIAVMGGMITTSCGSDDDSSSAVVLGDYTIKARISDKGNIPDDMYALMNQAFESYVTQTVQGVSLDLAKKALDIAFDAMDTSSFEKNYNYTIEMYIADSKGNKVYSRYVIIKDGQVTKQ